MYRYNVQMYGFTGLLAGQRFTSLKIVEEIGIWELRVFVAEGPKSCGR